jgi:transglutaminase-like putative cysteine protease
VREYCEFSPYIDWQLPEIKSLALELALGKESEVEIAKSCFEFVRDNIKHSWDYRLNPVTIKASDVLKYGTGYCYAKSHLLAALLRANGIPAGLCYQRLTITDQPPFCIHGLNAVYLKDHGWYRVDARGNKEGIHAEFSPPVEHLAFGLIHLGEADIEGIF